MNIPKNVQEAIKLNNLVIFVGSGLSLKFKLPSWNTMVEHIITESQDKKHKSLTAILQDGVFSPLEVLDKLENEHNSIKKYIKSKFKIIDGDFSLHKKILDLTGQVITTNYDDAFERASDFKIDPSTHTSQFNLSEVNKSNKPYIFKLHGSYAEPDHCIIFSRQYKELYSSETAAKEKLKSIFIGKTILFVGFSFSDPDINLIFDDLDKGFDNNNRHYILTTETEKFKVYKYLETIAINDYSNGIDEFIDLCLRTKNEITNNNKAESILKIEKLNEKLPIKPKIAFLSPNPLDIDFKNSYLEVLNQFDNIEATIFVGTLNTKTLSKIEDVDLVIIVSKVFKTKIYIEEDNLLSSLFDPEDICSWIPNDDIPIVFITNEKIIPVVNRKAIYISSYKPQILNSFIYKTLRCGKLDFKETEIFVSVSKLLNTNLIKGIAEKVSFYGNDKNLDIGRKSLMNVVGRVEEQSSIASRLMSIINSNKLLNIKASGGLGKTTLIKKVAYEMYNRGYFKEGVNFKSCESIKTFSDFEETLIEGFNLNNIVNFREYLVENYSKRKLDSLIILDNFETVMNILNKEEFNLIVDLLKFSTDFANIVITSREKIKDFEDFEDLYSLTPLITDDALKLFEQISGTLKNIDETRILRQDILEDLLNNNPLAIKLVVNSRPKFGHISELKKLLTNHFFESINEDFTNVFNSNSDLNIERNKSIYQSINYSYTTLNRKEKIAFELLSLFPDGIMRCSNKSAHKNSKFV